MEFLKKMFNLFKKPVVNDELDRLEKQAKRTKLERAQNGMAINHKEVKKRNDALAKIESLRREILKDIAEQAERKICQENAITKALYQIEYNQDKIDKKQEELKRMENEWNVFHKRLKNL